MSDIREAFLESVPREHLPLAAQLGPFAILFAGGLWLLASWQKLPARLPIHWNWRGDPDSFVPRSPFGAALPLLLGAVICGLMLVMQAGIRRGAPRSPMRAPVLKVVLAGEYLAALVSCGLLGASITAGRLLWPVLALAFAAILALLGYTGKIVRGLPRQPVRNPGAWRAGFIYVDRDDPALFVPKRFGVGYTFNFGRPAAVALSFAFLVLPLIAVLVAITAR
ncbi:MAG: DUF5808 domain-containing protein [Myxococcales bacterium]